MFDANDTEAEEGYEHQAEDEDDDGEYAEAHEGNTFSTPAGSFAGDYEDHHAIGERLPSAHTGQHHTIWQLCWQL